MNHHHPHHDQPAEETNTAPWTLGELLETRTITHLVIIDRNDQPVEGRLILAP